MGWQDAPILDGPAAPARAAWQDAPILDAAPAAPSWRDAPVVQPRRFDFAQDPSPMQGSGYDEPPMMGLPRPAAPPASLVPSNPPAYAGMIPPAPPQMAGGLASASGGQMARMRDAANGQQTYGPPRPPAQPPQTPQGWQDLAAAEVAAMEAPTPPGGIEPTRRRNERAPGTPLSHAEKLAIYDKYRDRYAPLTDPAHPEQVVDPQYAAQLQAAPLSAGQQSLELLTGVLKGAERGGNAITGLYAPKSAAKLNAQLDDTYQPPSFANTVANAFGGALPAVASAGLGLPGMVAVGAAGGAGGARTEVAERRARGESVSGGQELAGAVGQGLIGGAGGVVQAKALGAAGKVAAGIANPVARGAVAIGVDAAGNTIFAVPSHLAGNAVAQQTYDPKRDLTAGTGDAIISSLGAGLAFARTAVHGANANRRATVERVAPEALVPHDAPQPQQPPAGAQGAQENTQRPPAPNRVTNVTGGRPTARDVFGGDAGPERLTGLTGQGETSGNLVGKLGEDSGQVAPPPHVSPDAAERKAYLDNLDAERAQQAAERVRLRQEQEPPRAPTTETVDGVAEKAPQGAEVPPQAADPGVARPTPEGLTRGVSEPPPTEQPAPAEVSGKTPVAPVERHGATPPKGGAVAQERQTPDAIPKVSAADEGVTQSAKAPVSNADVAPPATGKLDALEGWARTKLEAMGSTGLRSGLGGFPVAPGDVKRLALHTIIAGARISKGAVKFVEWSKEIVKDIPELAKAGKSELLRLFSQGRKFHGMDEDGRAAYVVKAFTEGGSEGTKTTIRRLTGQIDATRAVSELDALKMKLRAEAKGGREGYKQGVRDVTGLRSELARIVEENLPPAAHRQFLQDIAKVETPGQVALAIQKGRKLLADHDVREAISSLEELTGNLKVHIVRPPASRKGEPKAAKVMGDVDPAELKTVDIKTLPQDVRREVSALIGKARYLKDRLRNASAGASIEQKQAAVDEFNAIDREIRQTVANHVATQELRVGDRLVSRDKVASEIVDKLKTAGMEAPRTSEAQGVRGESAKKLFGRQALNMDAIATNMVGRDSDAYKVTIDEVRRAQSAYHGEQRRTHEAFEGPLAKAGIPAGSKRLNDWMGKREAVTLPDLGEFKMTRNEMLDIVATADDPQTRQLVTAGLKWSFENHLRETPWELTHRDVEAIRKALRPEELALIDAFRARNDELTPAAMRAKIDLSGWAPDPHKGYFPRSRNRMQGEEQGLPEGWRGYLNRALENVSSMKERAQDQKQPLRVKGFVGRVFDHFDDTARLIHLADTVRGAAAVWQHPETAKAVTRRYGDSMNERVAQFLSDTMMVQQNAPPGVVGRAWQQVARNVSRAWLQLNPSPMAKNVVGGTVSLLPEFDVRDWAHGVKHMFSGEAYRRMLAGSGLAWQRYHGGLYGAYSPLAGGRVETVAEMTFVEALKAGKPGQAVDAIPLMEKADSVPLRAAWAASEAFVERTQPTLTGDAKTRAVAQKFEEAVYRTQNGSSSTEASGFASSARGNPMLSAFLMFKSDSAKKYSLMAGMRNADAATRAKTLAAVALNALSSAGVAYGIKEGASAIGRAVGGAPADPEERKRLNQSAAWNVARDVAGIAPLGATFTQMAQAVATKFHPDIAGNPVESAISGVVDGVTNLGQAVVKWAESKEGGAGRDKAAALVERELWKLAKGLGTAGGVPLLPAVTLGERAHKAAAYQPPDPRVTAKREKAAAGRDAHDALPSRVVKLLSEKNRLDGLGAKRTQAEIARRGALVRVETLYGQYRAQLKRGNTADAERLANELRAEAGNR